MKNVIVITGGGSGMGLETAKLMDRDSKIIISGRTVSKLESAIQELRSLGLDAEAYACDVGDRASVEKLAAYAADQGSVRIVIHAAGVSPHMASAETIFNINAAGTIYVGEAFSKLMPEGGRILNVSSMSAYMVTSDMAPDGLYEKSLKNTDGFLRAAKEFLSAMPEEQRAGMAYTYSKNFVVWYTPREAVKYGENGIRVFSISPGTFSTPLGNLEGDEAAFFALNSPLGRVGDPIEIARVMAFMVSDACSYLNGVDLLYDGGAIAALQA